MVSENNFDKLMEKINYRFKNEEYLKEALTHRSYANENSEFKNFDNEKLEFLGDAVLNLIATEYIYSLGKGKKEGELAKLKSQIISEPVFSSIANDIELGNYLYLSNGEISSGGRKRKSIQKGKIKWQKINTVSPIIGQKKLLPKIILLVPYTNLKR